MAVAALLYAVLAILLFAQGLEPGRTLSSSDYLWSTAPWQGHAPSGVRLFGANGEDADAVSAFQPFALYARARLPGAPLWNPYIGIGRPFLADAQSAVLSPFSAPAYVLPFWRSLAVTAILKVFVAALGGFLLGRALGMRFAGAFLAGLVFGFGLDMIVWEAWPLTNVWAFIPWLLLGADRLARRPGPLPVVGMALVVALQFFGGHPESSFHALVVTVLFYGFRLATAPGPRRWRASSGAFVISLAAGTALAAVALVPFAELLAHSGDVNGRGGHAIHIPVKYVGMLFLNDYWGRPTGTELAAFVNSRAFYGGALTLMLAVGALVMRATRLRVAVALFGALCAAIVLGIPPFFQIVSHLPVFDVVYNNRLIIMVLLALALLAGWGLDEVVALGAPVVRSRAAVVVAAGIFVVPFAWEAIAGRLSAPFGRALDIAWGFATPPVGALAYKVMPLSALLEWVPLAGLGLLLLALRVTRRLPAGAFAILAVALITIDLFRAGMGQNPAIPLSHARQPVTGAIRYLQAQRPARFVGIVPTQLLTPMPADAAMRYGLYDARSYDYPIEARYDRLWVRYVAPHVPFIPPTTLASTTPVALRVLGLLGVSSLMQQPIDPPLHNLRLAYDGADTRVYANPSALPRAFLVDRQEVVNGDGAALTAIGDPRVPLARVAVTEHPLPGLGAGADASGARSPGSTRITSYQPQRVEISANATHRSLLVLSDLSYPGWGAKVDGHPVALQRVDYLLRGVVLPAGRHTVTMAYSPVSWRAGWMVSVLSALALVATAALAVRWRPLRRSYR